MAQTFQSNAPYAFLMDAQSGVVLYEKAADDLMDPASTIKILTAEVVFHEIREGRLKLSDEFVVSDRAWKEGGGRSGGSSMFAALGSKISVENLLRGLIVQSGNDAAISLAEGVAGSQEAFVTLMNQRAHAIGMARTVVTNPWGKGDIDQKVTARDMAHLADYIIRTYPEFYKIFGEKEFSWNKIKQTNRNPLLFMDLGADGLKTGDIKESGFGLVGSAVQGGQRLIVIVNGLSKASDRADEARKLLLWGFRSFESRPIFAAGDIVGTANVFGGSKSEIALSTDRAVVLLVPRGTNEKISGKITYQGPLQAPVEGHMVVGRLLVYRADRQILDLPVQTAETIAVGSFSQRAYDGAKELTIGWVQSLLSRK